MIDCILSIIDKTRNLKFEIIVVDNNSEPDLENIITKTLPQENRPQLHFINLTENIGFGRANNIGLKIAKGRNILFLNPDTVLINNAIEILSHFLDIHIKAGACGGNLYDSDNNPAYSFKRFLPGIFWEINELLNCYPQKFIFGSNYSFNYKEKPFKVGYITGADLMVKSDIVKKLGGFRNDYFLYYEETDLCFRIKKQGWEIYNIPSAKIMHLESKSFGDSEEWQSDFKTKNIEKSRNIYNKKNLNQFQKTISDFLYKMFLESRFLLLKERTKKDYYKKRKKYFQSE